MSGYCLDCGNEMCVCNICECEECKPIPAMTFVSFEVYEKLQAELREKDLEIEEMKDRLKYEVKMIEGAANDEIHLLNHNIERLINMNKTMREALQKISSHSVQVGFYSEPSETAKMAKEALEKVNK